MKRTILIAAALLAVIAAGAGTYAFAAAGDGTTINGCVGTSDGKLRVLSGSDTCKSNETALSWNSVGPAGGQGPAGAPGAPGAPGAQGAPGRDGVSNPDATTATMTVTGNGFNATPIALIGLSHELVVPQAVGGGGGVSGKTIHKPFNVTKLTDASSPTLMNALLHNVHATVLITLMQGGQAVGTTKLTNAAISDYVLHGNTETWSFTYQKIEWEFGGNTAQDDQSPA